MNNNKNDQTKAFKKDMKLLLKKYGVKCENGIYHDDDGNRQTRDIFVGGNIIDHRYEIFIDVKDACT